MRRRSPGIDMGLADPDEGARPATGGGEAPLPLLPHERDERAIAPGPRALRIERAADDVAHERVDTDCHGAAPARECAGEVPALLKPAPTSDSRR